MKERDYLKNKILLAGQIDGQKFKRTFTIDKRLGDGGAMVVAYEARHSSGGRGVLREFYPKDSIVLSRDSNGQLILSDEFEEAKNRLLSERERYIASYRRIQDILAMDGNGELNKYLPIFEIYYGCDEDMNEIGTVYIWTPEPKLQTFDKMCEDNHRHPSVSPEYKLVSSLKAIMTLTEAVMDLHMTGFIHRDIKPSNFGFQMFHNKISTENFKIFDIDSIIPVTARRVTTTVLSEGFSEPEAQTQRPSVKTDIYSIGATLFAAVIVQPGGQDDFRYKEEYFDRIDEMVAQSALISCSEMNSNPRLRHAIAKVLKGCLAPRSKRYERCEDLLSDMEDALYYALPGEITLRAKSSEKWVLAGEVKAALDKAGKKNASGAFINHLYEYPFYRYSEADVIDILVAGFDGYSQKFTDLVLQTGHMSGKRVRITVLIADDFERMIYLEERPALSDFYTIDGKAPGGNAEDSYGEICFVQSSDARGFIADSKNEYTYILVNPEGDEANYAAAKQVRDAVASRGYKATISYVVVADKYKNNKDLHPLCLSAGAGKTGAGKYASELERMAFNVHLLWEPNLNVDMKRVRRDYMDPYNHFSNLCAALSLKYKLYSIGFDLDVMSPKHVAASYSEAESYNANYSELVALEHRRWVTEKICTGWTKRALIDSAHGDTRDRKAKNHICILTSRADMKLRDEYTSQGLSTWDTMSDEQLMELDELDRMSVKLHRLYIKQVDSMISAGQLSITSIQNSPYYKALYHLVDDDKQALLALQEWFALIREIYVDSPDIASRKVRRYASLRNAFIDCCQERLSQRVTDEIRVSVDAFDAFYNPVILSREYRDWKQADANIIEAAPFIITYSTKSTMVIPYDLGAPFDCIAAPTVVNPSRIIYLAMLQTTQDADTLITSLQGVAAYAAKKNLAPDVDILVLYNHKIGASISHSYEKQILATNRVRSVTRIAYRDMTSAANSAKAYLKTRVRSGNVAMMLNDTPLCKALDVSYPTFRFDSSEIKFADVHGCEEYLYIAKKPFFTVAEAMAFMSSSYEVNAPEFYGEVDALWAKYHEDSSSWHALANTLQNHARQQDFSTVFEKPASDYNAAYKFILPYYCAVSCEKLCSSLTAWGVINNVQINGHTSVSIMVSFMSSEEYRDKLSGLFSNSVLLGLEGALIVKDRSVFCNSLNVENVRLSSAKDEELLSFFQSIGYINCLRVSGGCASFAYATAQVKALLTEAGAMLQIYAYHALKAKGEADDIICNYKPDKDASEYDIVMTKGYKMYYIKCVNGDCPKQDYPAGINSSVLFIDEQGLSEIAL